ncbi:hypothetical protein [Streptomyces sp. AC550_RSS872]|uniref:phosphotransferase family protein n=1 Tax=Streptomyces sp. AC550_RSS872 TaxID=2823689 RepID=UPI0020B806DF|nr:hypothetical protein [Streptomyces sp. AC550_RSS872]
MTPRWRWRLTVVGNVLRDETGHPKVIDLDGFVTGPRGWDLMQTAMYYDSFGWHTKHVYEDFAEGYGFDVREWSGYPVLRRIRELLMVTWLSQNAGNGTDPSAAEEVEKRVQTLKTGASRRDWALFQRSLDRRAPVIRGRVRSTGSRSPDGRPHPGAE